MIIHCQYTPVSHPIHTPSPQGKTIDWTLSRPVWVLYGGIERGGIKGFAVCAMGLNIYLPNSFYIFQGDLPYWPGIFFTLARDRDQKETTTCQVNMKRGLKGFLAGPGPILRFLTIRSPSLSKSLKCGWYGNSSDEKGTKSSGANSGPLR